MRNAQDSLYALEGHLWNDLRFFSRKVPALVYDAWAVQWMLAVAGACAARNMPRARFLELCGQAYEGDINPGGPQDQRDVWPAHHGGVELDD